MPHRAKFDAAFLVFLIFPLQFLYSPTPKQKIKLSVILYSMFVLGWLALVSVPLGAVGLLGSAVWFLVVFLSKRSAKNRLRHQNDVI